MQGKSVSSSLRAGLALQIIETTPDALLVLDRDLRIVFGNPAAESLFGLKEAEFLGRLQADVLPAPAGARIEAAYARSAVGRVPLHLEYLDQSRHKWFSVEATPVEDGGLVVRIRDASERQRAVEDLRNARQRFSVALDKLPAHVVLLTPDHQISFANRFFRDRFGEPNGRPCFEHLYGRSAPCENCQTFEALRTGAPHRWECTGPDGRDYDVFAYPFQDGDGSNLVMEAGFDLTDHKRAQAELAARQEHLERVVGERTRDLEAACARLEAEAVVRLEAEAALRRIAHFPEENPNPVLRVTAEGAIDYANASALAWLKAAGATEAQPVPSAVAALALRAVEEGRTVEAEFGDRRGETFWFAALRPPGENYVNLYGRDVTKRKRAEESVRENQARLETVFAALPNLVFEYDAEGKIVRANDAALKATGFDTLNFTREQASEALHIRYADGRPVAADKYPTSRALRGEKVAGELYLMRAADGIERVVSGSAGPIYKDGVILGSVAVLHDVTNLKRVERALRESEERLSRAQEIAHLGSWELDLARNRIAGSDEAYRIFGLTPREFGATYEAFLAIVHPEDRASVDDAHSGSLRDNRDGYEIEYRVVRQGSDEVRFIHARCQHQRDEGGRIVRSTGTVHDITERRRAEERLRLAQKLESIGVLAGGVAHDFNNLLTAILGNASLLQMDPEGRGSEQLRSIVESSEKAAALTHQLLAYAGKSQFHIAEFDVARLVRSSADLIRLSIPKNIRLEMELPPNLPAVRGDVTQVEQVIMNLVINAAEAIEGREDGKVALGMGACELDSAAAHRIGAEVHPGCYVAVTVEDNGCGMDEATMAKIFDPFFTTKFMGRGLGLAAVHGILTSHKAAITVASKPGVGSSFTVYLPCI
jgi:PAS domain S-box-containing protein